MLPNEHEHIYWWKPVLMIGLMLLYVALLNACTVSGQSNQNNPKEILVDQATAPESAVTGPNNEATPDDVTLATQQAAVDNSGKPGPPLPTGNAPAAPGLATPTSTPGVSIEAGMGTVGAPGQATGQPQATPPTLSPEEIQTRAAVLENSGKPGLYPPSDAQSGSGLPCFGGAAVLLAPLVLLAIRKLFGH